MVHILSDFNSTRSFGFASCLVIGVLSLVVVQTPVLSGQVDQDRGFVQQPTVQPAPSQVYRGRQSFQGQPIQGQPIPGQIIQGQPIQGQPIQGQPIQGQPIQGGVYRGQIIQQPGVPNYQPAPIYQPAPAAPPIVTVPNPAENETLEAERAAYREAISKVKGLSEKNEALIAQNEGVLERFEMLRKENEGLSSQVGQLGRANENFEATVIELREKLARASEQGAEAGEAEQLRLRYRESLSQIEGFEARIDTLGVENQGYQTKISELNAALKAMESQPDDNMQSENMQSELTEQIRVLGSEKQSLMEQNESNMKQIQILTGEKQSLIDRLGQTQGLNERVSQLTASNEAYVSEIAALKAREIPEAPADIQPQALVEEPTADVSLEADVTRLNRKNRILSQTNSELEDRNRKLTRQLAELEEGDIALSSQPKTIAAAPVAIKEVAAALPAVPKAGGSILSWILPFLALGLGVAFFVIMREELHRPPMASGARVSGVGDTGRSVSQKPRYDSDKQNFDKKNRDNQN